MKKLVMLSAVLVSGFTVSAHALPDIALYSVCGLLAESKLPAACKATCKESGMPGGNTTYKLSLKNKGKSTSVSLSPTARASRSMVDEQTLKIEGGEKGGEYIYILVDQDQNVKALTLNDVECK